jgi:hypothetical protein
VQGGLAGSPEDERIVRFLADSRAAGERRLAERFRRARSEGDLPVGESPSELARYLSTVSAGLAVQAAAGASRRALMAVAERALRAFPGGSA